MPDEKHPEDQTENTQSDTQEPQQPEPPTQEELEQVELGGVGAITPPAGSPQASAAASKHHDLGARAPDLRELASPDMSNAELAELILAQPKEKMIPWESCKLPSRGLYYSSWNGADSMQVRGIGTEAEKWLANQRLAQSGESIDYLFRECCQFPDPEFDSLDLLVGDRVFLLYYLRGITHGNVYEFAITCQQPQCQQTSTHRYDLNELAGTIVWANENLGSEPFKVSLPYYSRTYNKDVWVEVRFVRGRDTNNMLAMRRTKQRMFAKPGVRAGRRRPEPHQNQRPMTADDTLTENIELMIHSFLGETDRVKIKMAVEKMHATDTATIREWLRENTPGIETAVTIGCPECGQEFMVELPITESFFRPAQEQRN